jgi:type II secretory pathway component PulC
MRSRLVVLLALLCALLAWVIYEEIAGIRAIKVTEAGGVTAAAGAPAPIASEAAFAMPDRQSLAVILERPLFTQTRRPSSIPNDGAPAASPDFTLSGVMISGGERSALIRSDDTGTVQQLKRGESIAGWTLVEIATDRVIVRRDATETEILLDYTAPAPPGLRTETPQQGTDTMPDAEQDEQQINGSGDPEVQPEGAPAN